MILDFWNVQEFPMRLLVLVLAMFVVSIIAGGRFLNLAFHLYRVRSDDESPEFFAALTIDIRSGFQASGLVLLWAILAAILSFLQIYSEESGRYTWYWVILQTTGKSLAMLGVSMALSATLYLLSSFFERVLGLRKLRWALLRLGTDTPKC